MTAGLFSGICRSIDIMKMDDPYMADVAFRVFGISRIIGLPALSFTGEMLTVQRIEATLIKSAVLAMRRPRQILLDYENVWSNTQLYITLRRFIPIQFQD